MKAQYVTAHAAQKLHLFYKINLLLDHLREEGISPGKPMASKT
jgi:hypothetical protein